MDANVLFSAARSRGAVSRLLHLAIERSHELWVDEYVVAEARRNIQVKSPEGLMDLESLLSKLTIVHATTAEPVAMSTVDLHEKDRPILAAAISTKSDALVTGDVTHFGHLYGKTIGGVAIHSAHTFAEWILK